MSTNPRRGVPKYVLIRLKFVIVYELYVKIPEIYMNTYGFGVKDTG
jgi:hypothetical protein